MRYPALTILIALVGCAPSPRSGGDAGPGDSDTETAGETDTGEFVCHGGSTDVEPILWTLPATESVHDGYDPFWAWATHYTCDEGDGSWAYVSWDFTADGLPDLLLSDDCEIGDVGSSHLLLAPNTLTGFDDGFAALDLPVVDGADYAEHDPFAGVASMGIVSGSCLEPDRWFHGLFADLTGDGYDDIALTSDCAADSTVGETHWLIYAGGEFEFATTPQSWPIPEVSEKIEWGMGYVDQGLHVSIADCAADQQQELLLLDIDGDRARDLVVLDACDDGGVGVTRWEVYPSTGSGFAADPDIWELPDVSEICAPGLEPFVVQDRGLHWNPLDVDGDGLIDLVVVRSPVDPSVGQEHWLVYRNFGNQLASEPLVWAIPKTPWGESLYAWTLGAGGGGGSCPDTEDPWRWWFREVNGDGRPDLLFTNECAPGGVGDTHWLVHVNEGDGFAEEPLNWCLPPAPAAVGLADPYAESYYQYACGESGQFLFELRDFDGDACPDLLITDDCDLGGVGADHWLVYPLPCLDIP